MHKEFRWIFFTHRNEMIWPREQISPNQNITRFPLLPLLVSFPLMAVLIDVAPMFKKLAIEEPEKCLL